MTIEAWEVIFVFYFIFLQNDFNWVNWIVELYAWNKMKYHQNSFKNKGNDEVLSKDLKNY